MDGRAAVKLSRKSKALTLGARAPRDCQSEIHERRMDLEGDLNEGGGTEEVISNPFMTRRSGTSKPTIDTPEVKETFTSPKSSTKSSKVVLTIRSKSSGTSNKGTETENQTWREVTDSKLNRTSRCCFDLQPLLVDYRRYILSIGLIIIALSGYFMQNLLDFEYEKDFFETSHPISVAEQRKSAVHPNIFDSNF